MSCGNYFAIAMDLKVEETKSLNNNNTEIVTKQLKQILWFSFPVYKKIPIRSTITPFSRVIKSGSPVCEFETIKQSLHLHTRTQ